MAAELSTEVRAEVDGVVIAVLGEVDVRTRNELGETMRPHLGPQRRVIVDLAGVTFLDPAGLREVVLAHNVLAANGGSLVLRNPQHQPRRLLRLSGLDFLLSD